MAYENYGVGVYGPYLVAGVPAAGTNEVQTLTIGGTPTGGSFTLALDGITTNPIPWSAVNATLLASMTAALNARFSNAEIVPTAGTLTAGIGTILLTFSGTSMGKRAVSNMTAVNALTGTSPTLAIAETTPGVNQTGRDYAKGAILFDTTTPKVHQQSGTAGTPTWQVVGAQV